MKTCLGIGLIILIAITLILTVAYNLFVNDALHFEQRDNQPDHVNPRRTTRIKNPATQIEVIAVPENTTP